MGWGVLHVFLSAFTDYCLRSLWVGHLNTWIVKYGRGDATHSEYPRTADQQRHLTKELREIIACRLRVPCSRQNVWQTTTKIYCGNGNVYFIWYICMWDMVVHVYNILHYMVYIHRKCMQGRPICILSPFLHHMQFEGQFIYIQYIYIQRRGFLENMSLLHTFFI